MAINSAQYFRTFISKTNKRNISSLRGSQEWEEYQEISEEDSKIRKEIFDKFTFQFDWKIKIGEGFDGKILYSYTVITKDLDSVKENSQNVEYQTRILVKKAGDECLLEEDRSDLEKFLMKNNFKKLK
jgi:hypothetical protein